jgi:hypothetical protein
MRDPAFLFYSKDFYEATRTMLPKERACYIDLLIYQHQNEYIPNEIERISMYCSGIDEATLQATLQAKFKLCDKGWYNERLFEVIEQRKAFGEKQSDNGLIGQFFKKAKSSLPSKDYTKLKEFIYFTYTKEKLISDLKINNNHEAMLQAMLQAMLKHLVNVNVIVNEDVNINSSLKEKEFNFKNSLLEFVNDEQVVNDYMEVRKKKKGANTETAFNLLMDKINESNMLPIDCIKKCIERNWLSFDIEWLNKQSFNNGKPPEKSKTEQIIENSYKAQPIIEDYFKNRNNG